MWDNFVNEYELKSSEKEISDFLNYNKKSLIIFKAIDSLLAEYFPNNNFLLEICEDLGWTSETKLLVNVCVDENLFFNNVLNYFKEIYRKIEYVIGDDENTIVLFPEIKNMNFDKFNNNSALNLVARTAYFNNYNNGIIQREVGFREIPKSQKVREILEYCKNNESPNISDMVYDLRLDLFDIDNIVDGLEENGFKLNGEY